MPLSDPKYLLYLLSVFTLYYFLRSGTPRVLLLVAASYLFYFNLSGYYVFVLVAVTVIAYMGGLLLSALVGKKRRGLLFVLLCTIALAPLIIFKYLHFFLGVGAGLISLSSLKIQAPQFSLLLPIGISFFTFAALGYLIDIYLETSEPERRPLQFALFLAFFPLITAGPIERGERLLPQLSLGATFSSARAVAAFRLILIGLILKLVFADNLVGPVDAMYSAPQNFIPLEKLFALVSYMFYVYADFAGYSLIAIGSAKLFGIEVQPNFQQPFLSQSVPEFWRNWHISLSSWVRDYLFTPLRMQWRYYPVGGMIAALMLSFIIVGAWHGAGWGFILFGVMHGLLVAGSVYTVNFRNSIWAVVGMPTLLICVGRIALTFVLVMLTFVVYRANSVFDAMLIYRDVFSIDLIRNIWYGLKLAIVYPGEPLAVTLITLHSLGLVIIPLIVLGDILVHNKIVLEKMSLPVQVLFYNVGIGLVLYSWASANTGQPFLYYKF